MTEPSTAWREHEAPGEAARFEELARSIATMQSGLFAKLGAGRALHRKAQGVLRARLDVSAELPAHARQGLFAEPGHFEALVRLSNASALLQKDAVGDIRGFAFKVLGVTGPAALGGEAKTQDFLCINQETFGVKDAGEFVDLAVAAAKGPPALLGFFFRTYGLGAFGRLRRLLATVNRPFSGFLTETFSTVLPVAWGPYAARLRLVPRAPKGGTPASLGDDVKQRLAASDVVFEVQLQFFVDEARTPIEDASAAWDEQAAPWLAVGTLTLPRQTLEDDDGRARQSSGERLRFDPWNALADHRPLGHIMRARKATYFASQQARGAE